MDNTQFSASLDHILDWLKKENQSIRTGQATPAVLDGVKIDAYGAMTPLNQVATVAREGAKSLLVAPYDKSQVKQIEKALIDANLGLSIVGTDTGVRVIFPDLTAERREMLVKLAKEKLEDARVSVRKERDNRWHTIQEAEKVGDISEDDKFRQKEEMEKQVKEYNAKLEELFEAKQREIAI